MTLEEALEEILNLKNEKQELEEKIEQFTTSTENLTSEKEKLFNEVNRLKQKNFEYFERLSAQFDKENTKNEEVNQQNIVEENVTIDDVVKSFE